MKACTEVDINMQTELSDTLIYIYIFCLADILAFTKTPTLRPHVLRRFSRNESKPLTDIRANLETNFCQWLYESLILWNALWYSNFNFRTYGSLLFRLRFRGVLEGAWLRHTQQKDIVTQSGRVKARQTDRKRRNKCPLGDWKEHCALWMMKRMCHPERVCLKSVSGVLVRVCVRFVLLRALFLKVSSLMEWNMSFSRGHFGDSHGFKSCLLQI